MPAYASLSYSATDNDGKYGLSDDRGQRWAVEFGSVIAPNFLVAVGYTNVVEQTSFDTFTILNSGFVPKRLVRQQPLLKIRMQSLHVLNTLARSQVRQCQLVSKQVSFTVRTLRTS